MKEKQMKIEYMKLDEPILKVVIYGVVTLIDLNSRDATLSLWDNMMKLGIPSSVHGNPTNVINWLKAIKHIDFNNEHSAVIDNINIGLYDTRASLELTTENTTQLYISKNLTMAGVELPPVWSTSESDEDTLCISGLTMRNMYRLELKKLKYPCVVKTGTTVISEDTCIPLDQLTSKAKGKPSVLDILDRLGEQRKVDLSKDGYRSYLSVFDLFITACNLKVIKTGSTVHPKHFDSYRVYGTYSVEWSVNDDGVTVMNCYAGDELTKLPKLKAY